MIIDGFDVNKDVLVIAEVGNNHEGSYSLAEEMIGLASQAGAGAVKFQTIVPEKLVSVCEEDRIRQLKKYQLSYSDFEKLSHVAKQENILFLSTPFDMESVHFLEPIVPAFKIASGDNTFYPLINEIARTAKPIILSTGLAEMDQIQVTMDFIKDIWNKNSIEQEIALLHCIVSYPAPPDEINLNIINHLKKLAPIVGFSDHTIGIEAAVLSVALGAKIIEKHFTIDKNYSDFHDHKLSADPSEFSVLVERVHEAYNMLGKVDGRPLQSCEVNLKDAVRRSVVARYDLNVDEKITMDNILWVRPGDGIKPGEEDRLLGKKLIRPIKSGEKILAVDVK